MRNFKPLQRGLGEIPPRYLKDTPALWLETGEPPADGCTFRSRFHIRNVLEVKKTALFNLGSVLCRLLGLRGSAHLGRFLVTEFCDGVLPCLLLFLLGEFYRIVKIRSDCFLERLSSFH